MKKLFFKCTDCDQTTQLTTVYPRCPVCNEPLEVVQIDQGQILSDAEWHQPFWVRYQDFYPYLPNIPCISLGEGFTPLTSLGDIAKNLNLKAFYVKNETMNPTWSFKDRGSVIGVLHAKSLGYQKIGTVSTGNMAASVAAYGAKAGLETYILVKGDMADEKINPIAIYNAHLLRVQGDYSQLYDKSLELGAKNNIYFINSDVPMRIDGSKSIAYEISEQLKFDVPDYVIVPTSAGGNFRGIMKGFIEFYNAGLIKRIPTPICAQSTGCDPIATAWEKKDQQISHFGETNTIAHGIGNPFPPSGNEVLRILYKYNGIAVTVNNEEIISAQRELASHGIFGQPASAVPLAATRKLCHNELIPKQATVAMIATGCGLKYTAAFDYHQLTSAETSVSELESYFKTVSS